MRVGHVVLGAAALAAGVHAGLFAPQSAVIALDATNFDKEILQIDKPAMVAFTAPWCGHCKSLVPQYLRVASELENVVKVANVDCDDKKNEPLCAKYGVRGFPTLKLFPATKKRTPRDYNGERTAKAIAEYLVSALPAEAVQRLEPSKLHAFVAKNPAAPKVLLLSPNSKSSPMYRSLALDFRGRVPFGYVYATKPAVFDVAKKELGVTLSLRTVPALYVVSGEPGEPTLHKYRGSMSYRYIKRWLDEVIDGKVAPDEPEPERAAAPKAAPPKRAADRSEETTKRAGMSEEDVEAAKVIGEHFGAEQDPEAQAEEARKAAEERETKKRKMDAIRRARAKVDGGQDVESQAPITEDHLMDKLQDLVGDRWGSSMAAHAIAAREASEAILRKSAARVMEATEAGEKVMMDGLTNDTLAIEEQLTSGVDDEGYELTKDMRKTLRKHHDMLVGMAHTLQLRIDGRKQKKSERQVAEELLTHLDL